MKTFQFCTFTLLLLANALEAKVVKHSFELYYFSGSPDGIYKDKILGINGQFPGPTIEAVVGDTLEITVINKIQDHQNTTIHWHGMLQKGSLFEDGTNQIAQCPLPYGSYQVYSFNVTVPGTYWYHSHVTSQYTEGLLGAIIVHNVQEPYSYNGEITLTLSDWYHRTAHENEAWYMSPASRGIPPYPDTGLINGLGRYPCEFASLQNRTCEESQQLRQVFTVEQNSTYRVRVINAAAVASFNFSIDGHILETIEVDGVDVSTPISATIVPIAAGQRYSFLIRPKYPKAGSNGRMMTDGKYLIRATVRKEAFSLIEGSNINEYPHALIGDVVAVLNRVDEDLSHQPNLVAISTEQFTYREVTPPPAFDRKDVIPFNEMMLTPFGDIAPEYVDQEFSVTIGFVDDENQVKHGAFNQTPFVLPSDKPLLMKLVDGEALPENSFPLEIDNGNVVQLVVNNPFGPHPLHLHGHHFWVMGIGEMHHGHYDSSRHNLTRNGVKRDTVVVQQGSWVVIRFLADNPGLWTFHCHIDWHNLSGMALTFVEAANLVRQNVQVTEEALRICNLHR